MDRIDQRLGIRNFPIRGRILEDTATESGGGYVGEVSDDDLDTEGFGACVEQRNGLWMASRGDKETCGSLEIVTEGHCLGSGRRLVEHRGIGNRHTRKIADHGLEIDKGLHAPLRDLRLIGSVGGIPAGVLQNIAADHGGKMCPVVSHTDIGGTGLVLRDD